jgi:hypothetical protein
MATDILQTIKLEISKGFKLLPYERISLHKLLGLKKSVAGVKILLNDIYKDPLFRESAIFELRNCPGEDVRLAFRDLLEMEIPAGEKLYILDYFEKFGKTDDIPIIMKLLEKHLGDADHWIAFKSCRVLGAIGAASPQVGDHLKQLARNRDRDVKLRSAAIISLSAFKDISHCEELIKEGEDDITWAVYKSLALLSERLHRESEGRRSEDDQIYTYSPEEEDKVMLDIRVLLGRMTIQFDNYNNRVKTEFINAMLTSNHRELLIYAMKALTSEDMELVERILYLMYMNADKLRDPDKLFRNLLSLSVNSERQNKIIVEIFERYFRGMPENRKNVLMRDKIYNYMVVTLDTFFETYRKDYMITSVIEKDYPENFQQMRQYILENYTPDIKKRLLHYLKNEDRSSIHKLLTEVAEKIPFMGPEEVEDFTLLLEIFYDLDPKSRELSAMRLEDINFEKRYLRNRIVRLCEIIGKLRINGAASSLVKIFNYVKKYPDAAIFDAVTMCLSVLNYSYMLGELELLLASGEMRDHQRGVLLLSQFSEQRSLNILLDYLKERADQGTDIIMEILEILLRRDIHTNVTANQVLKTIIQVNKDPAIVKLAILCLGRCGIDSDLEYLDAVFHRFETNEIKEAVVLAIGFIVAASTTYNKRYVIGYLQEYLKEPGIKIRIYSCSLLISLGNRDALKSIRDMMIIKNKSIQREILTIMTMQKSPEFSYFLISLLKEDYTITSDILAALRLLPDDELVEIDHFIVNIFKKFESPDAELLEGSRTLKLMDDERQVKSLETRSVSVLVTEIFDFHGRLERFSLAETSILTTDINELLLGEIGVCKGVVNSVGDGVIVAYFTDPNLACQASLRMQKNLRDYNRMKLPEDRLFLRSQIRTEQRKLLKGEFIFLPNEKDAVVASTWLPDRIILDGRSTELSREHYHVEPMPEVIFRDFALLTGYYELVSPVNFLATAGVVLNKFMKEEEERRKMQQQLDEELLKQKKSHRSPTSVAYAQALDGLGKMLKNDLNEINKYLLKRSTDKDLINMVSKMLANSYKRFIVEASKIIVE